MTGLRVPQRLVPYSPFTLEAGDESGTDLPFYYVAATGSDQHAQIQAILDLPDSKWIMLGPGLVVCTDTLVVRHHGTRITGSGTNNTTLALEAATDGVALIEFTNGAAVLNRCEVGDMTLYSPSNTVAKDAIRAKDTSQLRIRDVQITLWNGGASIAPFNGGSSVGIKLLGREDTYIERVYISADIPVQIGLNPNAPTGISVDKFHASDIRFGSDGVSDNPLLLIDTGVNLTHFTLDGDQTWVLGGRAIYWVDTTTTFSGNHFRIENMRYEQTTAGGNPAIQIEHNSNLRFFTMSNCQIQGPANGLKLRNVNKVVIRDTDFGGSGVALDVDTSLSTLVLDNVETASTMAASSMGGMQLVYARARIASNAPHRQFEYWQDPAGSNFAAGVGNYFMGMSLWNKQGTLADAATVQIPSAGGGITQGLVEVTYKGATKQGAFSVYIDNVRAYILDTTDTFKGTTETDIGNVAGKITVHFVSAASILLRNRLGESVDYTFEVRQKA